MAFERILVPLDGSHLAEAALPMAQAVSRHLDSMLVLAHALEEHAPKEVHGDRHLTSRDAAQVYLEQQRDRCRAAGLSAEAYVANPQDSDVARAIVGLTRELDTDLVAMCAHGRQSLRDRFLGPIAQRVLQDDGPPILLRTTGASPDDTVAIRHILVPVDFRHHLTDAFDALVTLALGFRASVTLLHAVDAGSTGLPAKMLPNTSFELSDRAREDAQQRLATLAEDLTRQGIDVEVVVSTEDPDDAIIDVSRQRQSDLILLISHGRSGVSAWYERSVGRRIIREPKLNLLLFRQSPAKISH